MFEMLNKIDRKLRERVEFVAKSAMQFGDNGVVEWAERAASDALFLGRIRDRDVKALERLEGTYNNGYYRNRRGGNSLYA